MTGALRAVLRTLEVLRRGFVVRNPDGSGMTDGQTMHAIRRIRDRSGVPLRGWRTTPIPASILAAGAAEQDPERRVLAMLGARGEGLTKEGETRCESL